MARSDTFPAVEHRRTRTPSLDIEEKVTAAALSLLQDEGPDALSIKRLSIEAGVAQMTVYNHFTNKAGVIDAVFRRGFERLTAAFADIDAHADAGMALRTAGMRYRALALESPATYEVMFHHSFREFEPSLDSALIAHGAFLELVRIVIVAMAQGVIAPGVPEEAAQKFWATSHGAVSLELSGKGFVDNVDAFYADLMETTMAGLAPRA